MPHFDTSQIGPEQMAQFETEFSRLPYQVLTLNVDAETLWCLCAQLQLALRHPQNTGISSGVARNFLTTIRPEIAPDGTALGTAFLQGFDPNYDYVADGGPKYLPPLKAALQSALTWLKSDAEWACAGHGTCPRPGHLAVVREIETALALADGLPDPHTVGEGVDIDVAS